jgi:hypothetical protein
MTGTASWYHCSVKTMSRSAGRSVVAAAAYRLGARLYEAEVDQTHDYRRRGGVTATFTCAPGDAPGWALDPEQLWNAANAAEKRKNSTLAREIELALPASVTPEARQGIARSMAQELADRYRVAVSVGIHGPGRMGDQRNHHAHILFTTRAIGPEGFGAKTRVLDDRKTGPQEVTYLRGYACDLINAALEDAGSDERVDHRSFAMRGVDQEPTKHLGPSAAGMERRDEPTERGDINREVAQRNQQLDELVAELAEIDATIAVGEERRLDDRFGAADAPAIGQGPPAPDDFAAVHRATVALVPLPDPGLAMFLPEPPVTGQDFDTVHNRTIRQASADLAVIQTEEAADAGTRFSRIRAWWRNLGEHFVSWREKLQERFDSLIHHHEAPSPNRSPDWDHDR